MPQLGRCARRARLALEGEDEPRRVVSIIPTVRRGMLLRMAISLLVIVIVWVLVILELRVAIS
jgi:hypothetical protein